MITKQRTIVCQSAEDKAAPPAGATKIMCQECAGACWISSHGRRLAQAFQPRIVCSICRRKAKVAS